MYKYMEATKSWIEESNPLYPEMTGDVFSLEEMISKNKELFPVTAKEARGKRDLLLSKCDWTQANDTPLNYEQKNLWRTYRQALRDIPQQSGFPENIVWPDEPKE